MRKGIIFDFDGTLFDSMWVWERAGEDFLHSIHVDAEPALAETLKEMSLEQAAAYLRAHYRLSLSVGEIVDGVNHVVEDAYRFSIQPKPHVLSAVEKLQAAGIRMCIATATDRCLIEAALRRCGMENCFEAIFTCAEVGSGKDEPHIYEWALREMKLKKEEMIVVEDALHAAKTAKEAGFYVVGVFDPYEDRAQELRAVSDVYVDDLSGLERLFCI